MNRDYREMGARLKPLHRTKAAEGDGREADGACGLVGVEIKRGGCVKVDFDTPSDWGYIERSLYDSIVFRSATD